MSGASASGEARELAKLFLIVHLAFAAGLRHSGLAGQAVNAYFCRGCSRSLPALTRWPGAARLDRFEQGAGGVPHLLLDRLVLVERLVAGRIGLPIADIAVELGGDAGGDEVHEAQPVGEAAADILGALDVAMDDDPRTAGPSRWRG